MVSIDPKIWGPSAWLLLHDVGFYAAKKNDSGTLADARTFFMSLRHILPCTRCQLSYDMHVLDLPFPKTSSRLPRWVYNLHNRVNDTISKNIDKPVWETWHIEYQRRMQSHRLRDIWPFVQSIAETYPHGDGYDVAVYQENVATFFRLLWRFLRDMKGYSGDVSHVETMIAPGELERRIGSRNAFREWITTIGRTVHIVHEKHYQCSNTCKK